MIIRTKSDGKNNLEIKAINYEMEGRKIKLEVIETKYIYIDEKIKYPEQIIQIGKENGINIPGTMAIDIANKLAGAKKW